MNLFLLRHGEAGKRMTAMLRDRERPLTVAGREELKRIGGALRASGFEFDLVASSPLKRAKDSATIVGGAMKLKREVEEWAELSPEGSREVLYMRLAKLNPDISVLCVGHEPYLATVIGDVTGREEGSTGFRIALRKGGLAKVTITGFSPRVTGELRWLLTPKQIRKMA